MKQILLREKEAQKRGDAGEREGEAGGDAEALDEAGLNFG